MSTLSQKLSQDIELYMFVIFIFRKAFQENNQEHKNAYKYVKRFLNGIFINI